MKKSEGSDRENDVFSGFWLRGFFVFFDLWLLGQMLRMVTQDIVIAHRLVTFASKSDSKWRNERVPTVKNDVFSGFWLRDLDLWPLGQMLRMVTQDIVIAHRLVAFASKSDSKWRNERVPTVKNDVFSGFWLRDLDLWPLGQMLRMVTQDVVIVHCLVAFASKSDSKWRNERVGTDRQKWRFRFFFCSVTLTFDIWVKCCEWWRKILWLRIVWWPFRVNRTVNKEMRGYRVTQRWTLFDARLRDLDLWPLSQMLRMVTQDNMIAHHLVAFASKSEGKWRNERVLTVKNDVFSGFCSVTLTFDLWVKCCEWWRKILWLRIVWWPLRVNRTVNEEMRGYRVTQRRTLFDARLRDLDLWPLGQMLRMVTQDNMIAHLLVIFESKSDSKWRNERVPRHSTLNAIRR